MIRFACEKCGYKISVHKEHAGKRGKCPKCKTPVIIPQGSNTINFKCKNCGKKISVLRKHSGRKGHCPNCKNPITIPGSEEPVYKPKKNAPDETSIHMLGNDVGLTLLEVPEELKLQEPHVEKREMMEEIEQELDEENEQEDSELEGRSRLPWFIDIFLYPVSISGLTHLVVFSVVFILTVLFNTSFGRLGRLNRLTVISGFLVGLYFCWYFTECVRESTKGNTRAPEAFALSGAGEMWEQMLYILGCCLIFIAPSFIYSYFAQEDGVFWLLLITGSFFFPMALLAYIMFDSMRGLNPILLISSIFSTFFHYCGLVLLVVGIVFAFIYLLGILESDGEQKPPGTTLVLVGVLFFFGTYAAFLIAHLIGRFYWKNEEKLNWEC